MACIENTNKKKNRLKTKTNKWLKLTKIHNGIVEAREEEKDRKTIKITIQIKLWYLNENWWIMRKLMDSRETKQQQKKRWFYDVDKLTYESCSAC